MFSAFGLDSSLWVCLNGFLCKKIYMRNMMMRTDEALQMVGRFKRTYMFPVLCVSDRNISRV